MQSFFVIKNYYDDLIIHFDLEKFRPALNISFINLTNFMNIIRETWIWILEKRHQKKFDAEDQFFKHFAKKY
jgi:hypothetical protein